MAAAELEAPARGLNARICKAGFFQSCAEGLRIYYGHCIEEMKQLKEETPGAVGPDECPSRLEHTVNFCEKPLLQSG